MHTITGIGKAIKYALALVFLIPAACSQQPQEDSETQPGRVEVKTATIDVRDLVEQEVLSARVVYLSKSEITAQSAGYITTVAVKTGEHVQKGQLLFRLETKEHRILKGDTSLADKGIRSLGVFTVYASADGYVSSMKHQEGDYVQEGFVLCSFTRDDQLFFKTFVPVRLRNRLEKGKLATIIMPDSSIIPGRVKEVMNELNTESQSLQVLVMPQIKKQFPENLNAEVAFVTNRWLNAQLVPKAAILSNERLDSFWVMKLVNDSTAVSVTIKPGIKRNDSVHIKSPQFPLHTRLLTEGNYGLPDTAKVEVQQ